MKIINRLEKIKQIDQLIRLKCTGKPSELAEKVKLSERQTRRYIEEMKDMGAEITFDESLSTYQYLKPIKFHYGFVELDYNQMRKNWGGYFPNGQKMTAMQNIFVGVTNHMIVTPYNSRKGSIL